MDATADLAQAIQDDANQERPGETKDLVTFWTKLDDVFDEIIGQFPKEEKLNKTVRSFLYQPERVSLNTNESDIPPVAQGATLSYLTTGVNIPQETFSTYRFIFQKPLLNVKSIQLLSAIIPNPQASIPDNQLYFTYYRLRNIYSSYETTALRVAQGAWSSTAPYFVGDVVTYAVPATIQVNSITFSAPYIVQFFTQTSPFVINTFQSFTSSGATTAAYNLTTLNTGSGGSGPGTWFVACTNGGGSGPSSSAILTYVPAANPYNYYVCNSNVTGGSAPDTNSSWTLVGQSGTAADPAFGPWSAIITYSTGLGVFYTPVGMVGVTTGRTYLYTSIGSGNVGNTPGTSSDAFWTLVGVSPATAPNYFDIVEGANDPIGLQSIHLIPATVNPELKSFSDGSPTTSPTTVNNLQEVMNRTFPDYPTFTNSLQTASASTLTASIPGDITFVFSETLNKIQFKPVNTVGWTAGGVFNNGYYYLLCGWNDPKLKDYYESGAVGYTQKDFFSLNLRSGFTWNGNRASSSAPYTFNSETSLFYSSISPYICPLPSWDFPSNPPSSSPVFPQTSPRTVITANSYPCLVYTQSIRLYCDVTQGSTVDSSGNGGLLSVVPMNASGLGVTFYQSSFDNDLTKIPSQLQEITISMKTDTGDNYFLPYSANVSLELAVGYK